MRKAITSLARLLDTVQRRFQRSRAGSVMILVVTLLVLMAIIGTAFLTTARNDRYSSQLHESNVQVDMLLEGVKNIILGRMAGENFLDANGQRWDDVHSDNWLASRTPTMMIDACGVYNPLRTYKVGDWVEVVNTSTTPYSAVFYVSRQEPNLNNPLPPPGGQNAFWKGDPAASAQTLCWEAVSSLFDVTPQLGISAEDVRGSVGNGGLPATFDGARGRNLVQLVFTNGSGVSSSVQVNGQWYPAFRFYRAGDQTATPPVLDDFQIVPAASASGNGIADSFLWRLPMGEINGVTYYAAVRVVDNNAAINLNTAGSSLYDFDANGNPIPNMAFFPGDVGIAELLSTFNINGSSVSNAPTLGAEFANLNLYRDIGASNYSGNVLIPLPDGIISTLNPNNLAGPSRPVVDLRGAWGQDADFRYLSLADAQFMGLGRRIDYPGHPIQQSSFSYSTFSWSDSAALAYFFDLVNPTSVQYINNGTGSASTAEKVLAPSLVANYYASRPWDPTPTSAPLTYAQTWFNQNYVYSAPDVIPYLTPSANFTLNNNFNRRPLVVARNPQSNMMPVHVREMDALSASLPFMGTAMGYNYNPNSLDPTRGNLPRVALNTADTLINSQQSFATDFQNAVTGPHTPTLWLGYYNAMVGALEPPYTDPFLFVQQNFQTPSSIPANFFTGGPAGTRQLAQQFRSSLRDPNGLGPYGPNRGAGFTAETLSTYLPPASQLLVRSLIAAVNTKDIRDSDDDVTSATIFNLPVVVGGNLTSAKLTVYGIETQPFITEVYVNNDTSTQGPNLPNGQPNNLSGGRTNPNGYVAIELYNPYEVPISLAGWTVASMRHTGVVTTAQPNTFYYPSMAPRQIGPAGVGLVTIPAAGAPVIQPKGFLVLENINPTVNTTEFRPWWVYADSLILNAANPTNARDNDQNDTAHYYYIPNLENVLKDPNNQDSTGDEFYLLKPRAANGVINGQMNASTLAPYFDENPATHAYQPNIANSYLQDMVPVDSFDFCGISRSGGTIFEAWHYVRANSVWTDAHPSALNTAVNPPRPSWKFVFRGHWDPAARPAITAAGCHEDGVATMGLWGQGLAATTDPWILTPPNYSATPPVGGPAQPLDGMTTAPISIGQPDYASSYPNPYPGIPLNNTGYGDLGRTPPPANPSPIEYGINKNLANNSTQTKFNAYPFGGFARTGDVLQAPFIGSYTITYVSGNDTYVLEMNPVTADAGFADDNNVNYGTNLTTNTISLGAVTGLPFSRPIGLNNPFFPASFSFQNEDDEEQVGRFVPLSSSDGNPQNFLTPGTIRTNLSGTALFDTYGWAAGIFDYFSALQTPDDDYLPNSKPEYYAPYNTTMSMQGYTPAIPAWQSPVPVANSPAGNSTNPVGRNEMSAPIEGLVNINTAPWKVLAQLPFTAPNLATVNAGPTANTQMIQSNTEIAQAIVRYRNMFGPFHSIFELNRVLDTVAPYNPAFSNAFQNANGSPDANDYAAFQGVLTPNLPGFLGPNTNSMNFATDGLITDFNQREAEVMRLSNLVTTRSDSFTVYLQVQGWRGAGTPGAQLVVQRRAAFIMDRSGSTRTADNRSQTTNVISVNIPTKVQTE